MNTLDNHTIDSKKAQELVREAGSLSISEIQKLQHQRLITLIDYAREHSPYLKEKYKDLPDNYSLADIPVSTRHEIVEHFSEWTCDPEVTLDGITKHLSDQNNIFHPYLGKYAIVSTSGTTAAPLQIVRDARHLAIHGALMQERYFHGPLLKDVEGIDNPYMKSCGIVPNTGHHSSYLSFLRMQKTLEEKGMADRALLIPVSSPTHEMVAALNDFQPEMIGCYPSIITILAREQKAKRLHIHPKYIGCSAEKLTEQARQFITEAFGCPVNDNYCSTEGGEVAMLCSHGHLHVNSDWIIVEPVDEHNNPVPDGVCSQGILVTNLANLVQPMIRYYMSDSIILHHEPCPCGLSLPYMTVEGRMEESLVFTKDGESIHFSGPVLILAAMDTPGCASAQFIQRSPQSLEIRMTTLSGYERSDIKEDLQKTISTLLRDFHAPYVKITIVDESPIRTSAGKMCRVYQDFQSDS